MKKRIKKVVIPVVVLLVVLATLTSVITQRDTSTKKTTDEKIKSVVIGVPNWKSAMATAYILRELIRKNLGVETRLYSGTNEEIYTGISNGTIHIHPEGRKPDHDRWHKHLAKLLEHNKNGINTTQGLCIDKNLAQQYNITHIKDLLNPGIAQYFDTNGNGRGEIWIGDKNWNTTDIEQIRAKSYGYDTTYELLQMAEEMALQHLEKAAAAGKLFAIHCYTPHWMHRAYNLYQLKEPTHNASKWNIVHPAEDKNWLEKSDAATAWKTTKLHIYYTKSLKRQYPAIAQLLKKTQFTLDELLQISYETEKGNLDLTTYAQQWVAKNR